MRLNPSEILSRLIANYWFVPLLVTLGGVALAVALIYVDDRLGSTASGPLASLHPDSAEGARALLSAFIGAMITAISVTFSVTIVALTVAAQHFGPRVLNSFVRQTSAQVVLGTFMATFVYSVLVLGAIRGIGPDAQVPGLAVTGAVVLVVISVGALIFYVHHISRTLQIGELAAAIVRDLRDAVQRSDRRDRRDDEARDGTFVEAPDDAAAVIAVESGYVQRIDHDAIVRAARAADAVVWIRREPGAFVTSGTPLALVHPPDVCDDRLAGVVRHACIVGRDRTLWQDSEFAIKQLVEIALRALSPGVNEPFTAMTCIDRLTESLACVAIAPAPQVAWRDDGGRSRLYIQAQPFETLLHAAFDPIRIFAGTNPAIYARLFESLAELALLVRQPEHHAVLCTQTEGVRRAAERAIADVDDRTYVESRYQHTLRQLEGSTLANRR